MHPVLVSMSFVRFSVAQTFLEDQRWHGLTMAYASGQGNSSNFQVGEAHGLSNQSRLESLRHQGEGAES